jgi:hypothetical protein
MSTGLLILTIVHVAISLVAIGAGLAAAAGMIKSKICSKTTAVFLWMTVATSVTGFFFPIKGFTPALGFGIFSLILLPIAIAALYKKKLAGKWRVTYVITAMLSLYLNCFVLVVQSFMKAGGDFTNTKPPEGPIFGATQGAVLLLFIAWTILAAKRFRPAAVTAAEPVAV